MGVGYRGALIISHSTQSLGVGVTKGLGIYRTDAACFFLSASEGKGVLESLLSE